MNSKRRLLGDERKGWVDITYLSPSGAFRLSRGNKGTLFILVKDSDSNSSKLQTGASGASSSSNGSSGSAAAGAPAGPPAGQPAVSPRPFDKAGLLAAIRAGDNATVVAMLASQPPSPVANPAQVRCWANYCVCGGMQLCAALVSAALAWRCSS